MLRPFKDQRLLVTFTHPAPECVGDEVLPSRYVHTWLCTNVFHANNIIERMLNRHDPFQGQVVHIPLDQVVAIASQRLTGNSLSSTDEQRAA